MKKQVQQYTLRGVPQQVDRELRRKARREGKSLNQTALEVLTAGTGLAAEPLLYHDLDALAGTWIEDPQFDEAIRLQDEVESELWK